MYDVLIVGGGPAGLSAALALGRARKRVLICDDEPRRRNAAAEHLHGFVTRDGTPPQEFRRIGREQLAQYGVEIRDTRVESIRGRRDAFKVALQGGTTVDARRILLATGMIDDLPDIEGFRELWGKSIFICPYCHAWEVRDQRFAYVAPDASMLHFADFLRGWTDDVIVLTNGAFAVPSDSDHRAYESRIRRVYRGGVELEDGTRLDVDVIFVKPPQRQVPVVASLGLALDAGGYVLVSEQRQTSIDGIYAGGDLTMAAQSAIFAAAAGYQAAAAINFDLNATAAASRRAAAGTSG